MCSKVTLSSGPAFVNTSCRFLWSARQIIGCLQHQSSENINKFWFAQISKALDFVRYHWILKLFLFVSSSSFISVCLPLVLEGDISNLAGFTRCMGAINLVGGCCQVRLPPSATCWLWYSSSTYSCQYSRGFVIIITMPQPFFGLRVDCWALIQLSWVNLGIHFAPLALSLEATWQINRQMHQSRSYDFSY